MNDEKSLVRQAREARGLSQAELATIVGTSQQTIDRIEKGGQKLSRFRESIYRELGLLNQADEAYIETPKVTRAKLYRELGLEDAASSIEKVARISLVCEQVKSKTRSISVVAAMALVEKIINPSEQ